MSKIRKKAKLKKIDGSYPEKSGVLSKSIKKIIQDEDTQQGRIPIDFLFSNNEKLARVIKESEIINAGSANQSWSTLGTNSFPVFKKENVTNRSLKFDDTKTLIFNNQNINVVLGVSSSYVDNINIFSPGNHFLTSSVFETNSKLTRKNVNYLKINQNKYSENYLPYNENLLKEKTKKEIIIDLPFDDDLILDNVKGNDTTFRTGDVFSSHGYFRKADCLYNFNSNGWDYKDSYPIQTEASLHGANMVNFTPPTVPSFIISSSSIGLPARNFGFPFANAHAGNLQHSLPLENYIDKPFLLEKLEIELTLSSFGEKSSESFWFNSNNVDLANLLSFYMLRDIKDANMRSFSNSINFNYDYLRADSSNVIDYSTIEINKEPGYNFLSAPFVELIKANPGYGNISTLADFDNLKTTDYNNSGYTDSYISYKVKWKNNEINTSRGDFTWYQNDGYFNRSTRELITYSNFLVYNNYNDNLSNIDWNSALSDIDYVKKIETGPQVSDAHINFVSSSIKISSKCKKVKKYTNAGALYCREPGGTEIREAIFLTNESGGRHGFDFLSGREETNFTPKATILSSSIYENNTNEEKIIFNNIISGSIDSPYLLLPGDKIQFGLHSFSNDIEFPVAFKLHDNIRVRLIGRYENLEDDNITLSNKQGMTSNSVRSTIIGNTTVVNQYDTEPIYFMSGSYLDNRFTGDIKSSSGRTIEGSLSSGLEGSFTRTVTLEDTENTIYDSMMPSILDIMKANNKNIWSSISYDGTFGSNRLYFVNQRRWNADSHNPPTSYNPWASDEFYNWGGSFEEWIYDFPFKDEYSNLARFLSLDLDAAIRNTEWEDLSTDLSNLMTEYETKNSYEATITQGQVSVNITNGQSVFSVTDIGAKLTIVSGPGSFGTSAVIQTIPGTSPTYSFETSVPHTTSGNIVFKVDNGTRDIARFNPGGSLSFNVIGKGGVATGGHLYNFDATNLRVLNKFLFSNIRVFDFPKSDSPIYYGHALKSSIAGNSNAVGTYGNPPIAGFKYGVYNPNPVSLTKHFNWRSYGQFSDRYNGSTNTAFFNQDKPVRYPVEKTFVDSEQNSIEASSVADTYNTDEYARSGRPFFD